VCDLAKAGNGYRPVRRWDYLQGNSEAKSRGWPAAISSVTNSRKLRLELGIPRLGRWARKFAHIGGEGGRLTGVRWALRLFSLHKAGLRK